MKLRVRFQGRRGLIELSNADVTTFSDVKQAVCQEFSLLNNTFQLSLDGKTPLPAGDGSTLRDLGIVGGDLLHVLLNETTSTTSGTACSSSTGRGVAQDIIQDVNHELLEQLLQMGFPKESVLRALHTTKTISLNEALDILSSGQQSTLNVASTSKDLPYLDEAMNTEKPNVNKNPSENEKEIDKIEMAEDDDDSSSKDNKHQPATSQHSLEEPQKLRKIEYTPKALLCRDGIPYLLQMCYEQALITTLHEAVCIAIHVLMLETGFVNHGTQENVDKPPPIDEGPSTSTKEDSNTLNFTPIVPENWRTSSGAKFVYIHPACPGLMCSLVCASLGPYVLAHGMSNSSSCDEVYQCRLSAADFVKGNVDLRTNISGAADVYRNLQRLSLSVKDQIAYPLLSSMRHELNLEEIYGFMALPTEVKLMVLCLIPVKCILNVSVTCRELYALANDHTLWQHLCFRDFGLLTKGKYSSWKKEYSRHYKDAIVKERNRQILSQAQYRDHHGMYNPYAPFTPNGPPGILGGRHDLFPDVPYMPGGIQPVPGSAPRPGHLPIPRFDPFGPVPDMDIIPGRRHPPGRGRGRGGFPPGPFF